MNWASAFVFPIAEKTKSLDFECNKADLAADNVYYAVVIASKRVLLGCKWLISGVRKEKANIIFFLTCIA
jgi:hypothetical protein